MVAFTVKKIVEIKTIGDKLKEARGNLGLSLKQVADELKISVKYLQALEDDAWGKIPGEVYVKSFLKKYTGFLKLNLPELLEQYSKEKNIATKSVYKKTVGEVEQRHLRRWPRTLRNLLIVVLVAGCIIYLGLKVQKVFLAPELTVSSPLDNLVTNQVQLEVKGQTDKEATVSVNGQVVFVNSQGEFSEPLDLQTGVNTVKIKATKKHSKSTIIERRVIYNP
jgi:cytoskeletal protein RodZ